MLRKLVTNGLHKKAQRFNASLWKKFIVPRKNYATTADIVIDDAEEDEIEKLAQAQEKKRMQQAQDDLHERITQQDIANQLFSVQQAKQQDLTPEAHYYKGEKIPAALYGIQAPDQATIHLANEFFINNKHATLQHSVVDEYPKTDAKMPEIAFIGRSNAGKSSLLNAICRSDSLASVSSTPGHTKRIHFYNISNMLYLVDMPGYGYAEKSKQEREKWLNFMAAYLSKRNTLMRVFVLLDARLGINKMDYEFLSFLSSNCVSHQIVLTKCDKLTHEELTKCMKQLYKQLEQDEHIKSCYPYVLPTSSVTLDGLDELRANALLASGIIDRKALLPQHKRELFIKKESKYMEQVVKVAKHLQPKLAPQKKAKAEKRAQLEAENQEKAAAKFKKNPSKVVLGLD